MVGNQQKSLHTHPQKAIVARVQSLHGRQVMRPRQWDLGHRCMNDLTHLYSIHSEVTSFRGPQSWENIWSEGSVGGLLWQLQVECLKLGC